MSELKQRDITTELWREYDFSGRVYRIEKPVTLYYHDEGRTHRVVTADGTAHCVPAPGVDGCVLRAGRTLTRRCRSTSKRMTRRCWPFFHRYGPWNFNAWTHTMEWRMCQACGKTQSRWCV